jgi:hypothetical protein
MRDLGSHQPGCTLVGVLQIRWSHGVLMPSMLQTVRPIANQPICTYPHTLLVTTKREQHLHNNYVTRDIHQMWVNGASPEK